jgi:hypothetical protein
MISTAAELRDHGPRVSPSGSRVGTSVGVSVGIVVADGVVLGGGVALGRGVAVSVAATLGVRVGLGGGVGVEDGKGGASHEVADALASAVRVSGGGRSSDSFWTTAVRVGEAASRFNWVRVIGVRVGEDGGVSGSFWASARVGSKLANNAKPSATMRSDKGLERLEEKKERSFMPRTVCQVRR